MRRNPEWGNVVLLIVLAGFLAGVAHLFQLRFEAGDSYPVYSSLRADPLGTKALYESLGALNGITVARNYRPLSKLGQRPGTTLFLFGVPASSLEWMSTAEARAIESFALDGGRLVFLLYPEKMKAAPSDRTKKIDEKEGDKEQKRQKNETEQNPKKKQEGQRDAGWTSLAERWHIGITREEATAGAERHQPENGVPVAEMQGRGKAVSWHSSFRFDGLGSAWKPLYDVDGKPVIVERAYGRGTVVLASDTWFVSNEALVKERRPGLLAWLAGPSGSVIFDETHFGIQEDPGVAALGRKYRLHGLFAGLLLVAVLFIWKNAVSLVPPRDDRPEQSATARAGKDSLAGLAGLLRRTVPKSDILGACVREWKKSVRRGAAGSEDDALVDTVVKSEMKRPVRERDPAAAYQRIHTLLSERKRKT